MEFNCDGAVAVPSLLRDGVTVEMTEPSKWLETLMEDAEHSYCPKCRRRPYTFYIEPESLFTEEHRCCSTCKTPLTAPED